MKTAFLTALRRMEIRDTPEPRPAADEALVAVRSVGICRSDVHYWHEGGIGSARAKYPQVLGHEAAGVVVECGRDVRGLSPGDRVALEPGLYCGKCRMCLQGKWNCCPKVFFLGMPDYTGAFQEFLACKTHQCHRLPEHLSLDHGALIEPMSVAVHAVRRARFALGENALVLGAGPIGLFIALCLRNSGAEKVIVAEPNAWRREKASVTGFEHVLDPAAEGFLDRVRDLTEGHGADFVFEAAGEPESFHASVMAAAIGATVCLVGICDCNDVALPMHEARRKELAIYLSRRDNKTYPMTISLAAGGGYRLDDFATSGYGLTDIQEAFLAVHERRPGVLKAMVRMGG